MLSIAYLDAGEAACGRVLASGAVDAARQKAAFFRGLMRFLQIVQRGAEQAAKSDGSVAYRPPTLTELRPALRDIETAIDAEGPLRGEALSLRVTINQTIGRPGDARADVEQAMKVAPQDATPYVQRALEHERAGEVRAALADLDRAVELKPDLGTALWARGDLLRRLGQLDRARADLATVAFLGPPLASIALTRKSELELRAGNLRIAYDDLIAATRAEPAVPKAEAAGARAILLVRAGDLALDKLKEPDVAEKHYRDAEKLDPKNWSAALGLARIEEQRGQRAKAIAIYRRIIAATRSTPRLYERILATFRLRELMRPARRDASSLFRSGLDAGIATGSGSPDGLKRIAFVIGEGDYDQLTSLSNARRDAAVMASALADMGFDVVEIAENLGKADLRRVPAVIAERAAQADVALVFYAGHGVEVGGRNYLIPVDASPGSDRELETDALALTDLVAAAGKARRGALVIVDACRNDPFVEARAVAASRGVGKQAQALPERLRSGLAATPTVAPNNVVFHSTQPGQTALDGDGLESPFLRSLLETLSKPGNPLDAVVRDTTAQVSQRTNGQQLPASYGAAPAVALLPPAARR